MKKRWGKILKLMNMRFQSPLATIQITSVLLKSWTSFPLDSSRTSTKSLDSFFFVQLQPLCLFSLLFPVMIKVAENHSKKQSPQALLSDLTPHIRSPRLWTFFLKESLLKMLPSHQYVKNWQHLSAYPCCAFGCIPKKIWPSPNPWCLWTWPYLKISFLPMWWGHTGLERARNPWTGVFIRREQFGGTETGKKVTWL